MPTYSYRCQSCGKTFSETWFTRNWHLQRRDIDEVDLLFEWCKGTSVRELAARFHCSAKAIENRITRMRELAESKDVVLEIEQRQPGSQYRL
jgi:transposase-like protein